MRPEPNAQGRAVWHTARGTTLLERVVRTRRTRLKKLAPTSFCRDESSQSRGTTLLGHISLRPAWTPVTEGQFGNVLRLAPFHSGSPGLAP